MSRKDPDSQMELSWVWIILLIKFYEDNDSRLSKLNDVGSQRI